MARRRTRALLAPVVLATIGWLAAVQPALAQWDYDLGVLTAWQQVHERDAGVRLVSENGMLSGMTTGLAWQSYNWRFALDGELLGGTLDYDGATQLGSPHKTDSKWRDRSAAMILERRLRGPLPIHVGANLRYRWLDRSIQSTASVAGLSENYRTFWLGVRGLVKPTKALSLSVNLAHALDSTVAVAFDSALDNVALDVGGHWRAGIAANLDIRRMGSRTLYLRPFADWQQSPRTASAPLTSGGMPVGTVFLPETEVLRFGLTFGVRGQQQPPES